jgi:hypothetical protein
MLKLESFQLEAISAGADKDPVTVIGAIACAGAMFWPIGTAIFGPCFWPQL